MATAATLSSSSSLVDGRPSLQPPAASPQCVTLSGLPPPPPAQPQSRVAKTTAYCRKIARNVVAMATGDVMASPAPEVSEIELPEMLKTIQGAWDKVEDKYAVSSLAVFGVIAAWGSTGLISAIDSLPLVPGAMELVGIGYSGWFAYRNLIFKPDREALLKKVKEIYNEIIGSS